LKSRTEPHSSEQSTICDNAEVKINSDC